MQAVPCTTPALGDFLERGLFWPPLAARITGTVGKAGFDLNQAGDRAMTGGNAPMRAGIYGSARCRPQPQVGHISGHFDATDNLRPLSNIHRWQGAPRSRRL